MFNFFLHVESLRRISSTWRLKKLQVGTMKKKTLCVGIIKNNETQKGYLRFSKAIRN